MPFSPPSSIPTFPPILLFFVLSYQVFSFILPYLLSYFPYCPFPRLLLPPFSLLPSLPSSSSFQYSPPSCYDSFPACLFLFSVPLTHFYPDTLPPSLPSYPSCLTLAFVLSSSCFLVLSTPFLPCIHTSPFLSVRFLLLLTPLIPLLPPPLHPFLIPFKATPSSSLPSFALSLLFLRLPS